VLGACRCAQTLESICQRLVVSLFKGHELVELYWLILARNPGIDHRIMSAGSAPPRARADPVTNLGERRIGDAACLADSAFA